MNHSLLLRILRYEAPATVGAALLAIALPRFLLPACLLTAAFLLMRRYATGQWVLRTPVDWGITALVLLLPVNYWISASPEITGPQILRLLLGIGLFYVLIESFRVQYRLRLLYAGYLAAGLGLSAFAFISVDWTPAKLPWIPAVLYEAFSPRIADSIHPNVFAGTLLPFLLIAAALILWKPEKQVAARLGIVLLGVSFAFLLVLSQSRSAVMAFGMGLLVLVTMRWRWGWVLLAAAAAAGVFVWASDPAGVFAALLNVDLLDGIQGRVDIWARSVFLVQDFAFTGIGMGQFHPVVSQIYPFFNPDPVRVDHAHNLFLQVAVDLGIPGLVAWLSVYLGVLASGLRAYRQGAAVGDRWQMAAGAAAVAVQVGTAVHGLFDAANWGMIRAAPLLWAVWAGAVIALKSSDSPLKPNP